MIISGAFDAERARPAAAGRGPVAFLRLRAQRRSEAGRARPVPKGGAVNSRILEIVMLAIIALAILVGGQFLLLSVARFHGLAVSVLAAIAIVLVYAFRRNFLAGGPQARIHAARDGAFLAAIFAAIAFVIVQAKWSLGATIVALEIAIVVELLALFRETSGA